MKMERTTVPFEIKAMTEDPEYFYFEGYLSTFGNEDFGGDIVHKGAFIDSIRSWKSRGNMPTLWQHAQVEPVGVFIEMNEDEYGLFVKGRLPKADTFVTGRVMPQMRCGSVKAMSIGYRAEKYDYEDNGWTRNLRKIDLFEGSLVTMPMNPKATITGMKSLANFLKLPFASRDYSWNRDEAKARLLVEGKLDDAYLWRKGSQKRFLIADIVDGKLSIVPKALFAVAVQLQLGDLEDPDTDEKSDPINLTDEEIDSVKMAVSRYYKEMGQENPFAEKDCVRLDFIEQLTPRELERLLRKGVCFSQSEAKRIVKLIGNGQREVRPEPDRDDHDNLKALLDAMKNF